jgi:Flp pilus assembly protein TadB
MPCTLVPDFHEHGTSYDRHGARGIPQGGCPHPVLADRTVMRLSNRVRVSGPRTARARAPRRVIAGPRWVGCITACAVVATAALLPLTTALAAGAVGATASLRYRRRLLIQRAMDEGRTLETALDVLVGELRVGSHPPPLPSARRLSATSTGWFPIGT